MKVFSKSYLPFVVETQGRLFDSFARSHPNSDTDDFISAYMKSDTRAAIDAGQAYVSTMDADTLMAWFMNESGYHPKDGESMKGFMPDWIGRFYAQCQWMTAVSSRETSERIPLSYLKAAYPGLHDLDLDLAVEKAIPRPSGR